MLYPNGVVSFYCVLHSSKRPFIFLVTNADFLRGHFTRQDTKKHTRMWTKHGPQNKKKKEVNCVDLWSLKMTDDFQ